MEQLAKFITDERTGLEYELCGDYYIIAGEDEPEREPIGIWGQRHLKHIQKHCKPFYNKMLIERTLYDYLLQLDRDAEDMFNRLVKQMAEREGVTEILKAKNQKFHIVARMTLILIYQILKSVIPLKEIIAGYQKAIRQSL